MLWIKILFYALLSGTGVLKRIKYSQKVKTMTSGSLCWLKCIRQVQSSTEKYLNPKQLHTVFDAGLARLSSGGRGASAILGRGRCVSKVPPLVFLPLLPPLFISSPLMNGGVRRAWSQCKAAGTDRRLGGSAPRPVSLAHHRSRHPGPSYPSSRTPGSAVPRSVTASDRSREEWPPLRARPGVIAEKEGKRWGKRKRREAEAR